MAPHYSRTFIALRAVGLLGLVPLLLLHCLSPGPKTGSNVPAEYIGDRTVHNLAEGILSIPMEDGRNEYENLHYVISAFVNPLESSIGSSTYDAVNLLEKFEPRLSAAILRKVIPKKPILFSEAQSLHAQILQVANATFKPYYERWSLKSKYSIELDITVFYFSNSVENRRFSTGDYYSK